MKRSAVSLLLVFCLLCSLFSSVTAAETPVTVIAAGNQDYAQAQEIVRLVNRQRNDRNLASLTHSQSLCALAMQRAAEIALHYDSSHLRPDGSSCKTIVEGAESGSVSFGENIAAAQADAAAVMEAWMNSQGHRENILNPNFTRIGVGAFEANGVWAWVQLFGSGAEDASEGRSDVICARVEIRTLPGHLDLSPAGTETLTLEIGAQHRFSIRNRNTNDSLRQLYLTLIPQSSDVVDADGRILATVQTDAAGNLMLEAVNSGSGTAEFPLYPGDPSPYRLNLTVAPEPDTDQNPSMPFPGQSHRISLRCTSGGTASVTPSRAKPGQTVTLRVQPQPDYRLDNVILRGPGQEIPESRRIDANTVEIIMPHGDLELEVYFRNLDDCPFTDVSPEDYFYEPVLWALHHDVASGTSRTRFSPDAVCSRAQVVTMLWSACGKPEPSAQKSAFRDVQPGDYYYKAVLWAVEQGITSGVESTRFGADDPCSRSQTVTMLWNAAGQPSPKAQTTPLTDISPGDYFYQAVLWAVENDITSGIDQTHFAPQAICTRAQVVTFLYNTYAE